MSDTFKEDNNPWANGLLRGSAPQRVAASQSEGVVSDKSLEELLHDPAAVKDLMVVYGINRNEAQTVWNKFIEAMRQL